MANPIFWNDDRYLITHEHLLSLVRYEPLSGKFYTRVGRPGVRKDQALGHVDSCGYRRIMIEGRRYLAHRLAWFYVNGSWPQSDIDHKNLQRDDNWIDNLRPATVSQNQHNRGARKSKSGLKGAHWNAERNYWQAYIRAEGRNIFLGRFDNPQSAHEAYMAAAIRYHGEFARAAA